MKRAFRKPASHWQILGILLFVALTSPLKADAHQMRPAVTTIIFNPNQTYDVAIALNIEALIAGIEPQHTDTDDSLNVATYNLLRKLPPDALRTRIDLFASVLLRGTSIEADGLPLAAIIVGADVPAVGDTTQQRVTTLHLTGTIPSSTQEFVWGWAAEFGPSIVRVSRAGEETMQTVFLNPGVASRPFAIKEPLHPRSILEITTDYFVIGFTHIVPKGLDHILFVLGIFLLSLAWRPLLYQVTAFTLAHTITLGLSLYGLISLSPSIVEPLIAASIVYIGIENILTPLLKPWRIFVVFGFGLLHGMGFAGILTNVGLPQDEFLNALISFNVGVELGQLTVLAGAYLLVGHWFKKHSWYRQVIVIPGSAAITVTGTYWTIERFIN